MGILYLVSTPIGNLKDITLRAIEILSQVDIIACEDTRKTGFLLKHLYSIQTKDTSDGGRLLNPKFGVQNTAILAASDFQRDKRQPCRPPPRWAEKPKLLSYYEENEQYRIPQIIKFLKEGKNVALVSNAGTPTISDPGFKLVQECIYQGIEVESIPGPSSVLASLVASGLPTDKFLFLGYLPKKPNKRLKVLKDLALMIRIIRATVIIYLSPHRLVKELKDIQESFGDIEIVLCRELTKVHEEIRREKISQTIRDFEKTKPRGEFVVLFRTKKL